LCLNPGEALLEKRKSFRRERKKKKGGKRIGCEQRGKREAKYAAVISFYIPKDESRIRPRIRRGKRQKRNGSR